MDISHVYSALQCLVLGKKVAILGEGVELCEGPSLKKELKQRAFTYCAKSPDTISGLW
jgi:hypothetical protein